VPIRPYAEMSAWLEAAADGEHAVLTSEDPSLFFTSSGSTGAHKKIPVTATFMRECFLPFAYAAMGNFFDFHPEAGLRDDATINFKWDPTLELGRTATGRPYLGASQVDYKKSFGEELAAEPGTRAPWSDPPAELENHLDRIYYRVRLAAEADVRAMIGINPAVIAALPSQIERWTPRLLREIAEGTVLGRAWVRPNPGRAAQLEDLAAAFGRLLPYHIWPRLQVLFCWTGASASVYLPLLGRAFGPDVEILPAPVAASESPIGVSVDRHPSAGVLVLPFVFFEFLPADREVRPGSATLLFSDLEDGGEYQVVLTHVGGLYRYALGDVVRVVDHFHGVPRVEFLGRRQLLSGIGEWTLPGVLRQALDAAGLRGAGFRFRRSAASPVRLEAAVEIQGRWTETDIRSLAWQLDRFLSAAHLGYAQARQEGTLTAPIVVPAAPGTFVADWEARVARGTRPAQVKDRVCEHDPSAWETLIAPAAPAQEHAWSAP